MARTSGPLIATGLARGSTAEPALAAMAVQLAMEQLSVSHANAVLLFLSDAFVRSAQPALLAASRASQCIQVAGGCAAGVFTEQDWVLDAPAAAAMVFSGPVQLGLVHSPEADDLLLSFASAATFAQPWLNATGLRFGGITGHAGGAGPSPVWQHGRLNPSGRCELYLHGCDGATGVSHGIRALSDALEVTSSRGFDLLSLQHQPALNTLARELPLEVQQLDRIPLHRILAAEIIGDTANALNEGRYHLIPLVATDPHQGAVTLASRLVEGDRMFWALRQPAAAEHNMRMSLIRTEHALGHSPDFAIMATSAARGAAFYGDDDRDLLAMTRQYPGMPIIGFYSNGEFASLEQDNHLLEYACSFGLFHAHV